MPEDFPSYNPEDLKSALINQGKILEAGADLTPEGHLDVTQNTDTIEKTHKEMEDEMAYRELSTLFTPEEIEAMHLALAVAKRESKTTHGFEYGGQASNFNEKSPTLIKKFQGAVDHINKQRQSLYQKPDRNSQRGTHEQFS